MSFREGLKPNQPFIVSKEDLMSQFKVLSKEETADLMKPEKPKEFQREGLSLEQAELIMGADFFGIEAVEKTFGIKLEQEQVPEIPFSAIDLERVKELGQFLVLRTDKAPDGKPLTMQKMNALLATKFIQTNKGKILRDTNWYKNEDFFKADTPQLGWALVSKENIPGSTSKNYLEQTEQLVKYITEKVFKKDETIPQEYQDAINEFENYYQQNFAGKTKDQIKTLLNGDNTWKKYAEELGNLKINQLVRQNPADALYDILMYFEKNGRILENKFTWTKRRSSSGHLVFVGCFDANGADVILWRSGDSGGNLGVSFSRSLKL